MVKNCQYLFLAIFVAAGAALAAEEESEVKKQLPIGADVYLSQNVGAGTAFSAYQQSPYVASNIYLYPYYKFGPFLGEREFKIHAELSSCFEWLGKDNPFPGTITDKFTLGDLKVRAEFKKALYAQDAGLSLTPAFKLEAPLSKGSRDGNRVIGLGGYLVANWSKWGFFATYKPVLLGYAYSAPYKTGACSEENVEGDKLGNGVCKASGRQTMAMLKNGFFTGYSGGAHTITLGFRSYHAFLRGENNGEKPSKTATSDVMEATLGILEYAYNLPVDVPTTLMLGVSGYQAPYDSAERFRVPFFNFDDPATNETEAYVAINVSI